MATLKDITLKSVTPNVQKGLQKHVQPEEVRFRRKVRGLAISRATASLWTPRNVDAVWIAVVYDRVN
jgi:hypothetical protein